MESLLLDSDVVAKAVGAAPAALVLDCTLSDELLLRLCLELTPSVKS